MAFFLKVPRGGKCLYLNPLHYSLSTFSTCNFSPQNPHLYFRLSPTDMDEELCDGNVALVNPTTGYDYDCMNGRETCPAGSYCHRVGGMAKCCKEGMQSRMSKTTLNYFPPFFTPATFLRGLFFFSPFAQKFNRGYGSLLITLAIMDYARATLFSRCICAFECV